MGYDFKRADGLLVCVFCGATFSETLEKCPSCKKEPVEKRWSLRLRILCERGVGCEAGGPDDVCCLSCPRFEDCNGTCFTAETFGGRIPRKDEVLCEFMVREEGPRLMKRETL